VSKKISLKGYFRFKDNEVFYLPAKEDEIPHKVRLKGTWAITRDHKIIFLVDKSQSDLFGSSLTISGKIEKAQGRYLSVVLLRRRTPIFKGIKRITLKGSWKLVSGNKLVFRIKRSPGSYDELTFQNTFKLTPANQIVYTYKRRIEKRRAVNSFILRGDWNIKGNTLRYRIGSESRDALTFGMYLGKEKVDPHKGMLRFSFGPELKRRKQGQRELSLRGRWRKRQWGMEFVFPVGKKKRVWKFRIDRRLSQGKRIELYLAGKKDERLRLTIVVSKKFLGESYFFVKAKRAKEKRIEAGVYIPF